MLPQISLDDESYSEIFEQARNKISLICPEWTDYNEHDPGITFLQLLAWFKEAQQYYLDHKENSMRHYFLQLLGTHCQNKQPACGRIHFNAVNTGEEKMILSGTPFYSENMCLTLTENACISGVYIKKMSNSIETLNFTEMSLTNGMRWYIFGKNPHEGEVCTICFSKSLNHTHMLSLYLKIFSDYSVKRTPYQNDYPKFAEYIAEAKSSKEWIPCKIIDDETASFTESGRICIELPINKNIESIRFKLEKNSYDIPPVLSGIYFDVFNVCQKEQLSYCIKISGKNKSLKKTYASVNWKWQILYKDKDGYLPVSKFTLKNKGDEIQIFLPEKKSECEIIAVITENPQLHIFHPAKGSGFPYQEFDLQRNDLLAEEFSLLIMDNYEKKWYLWQQTDDLLKCSHLDRAYLLDETKGKLYFGDGLHGRMPDGELWIVSMAYTLAEKGNLKSGNITSSPAMEIFPQTAYYESLHGGAAPETPEECRNRKQKSKLLPSRAVTIKDYEKLVKSAPGLIIKNCKVKSGSTKSNSVHIIVEPYSVERKSGKNTAYKSIYKAVLKKFLEPARLIGTQIKILFPMYADIEIYASATVNSDSANAEKDIRRRLNEVFNGEYCRFGKPVLYSDVYSVIDKMPQVLQVQEFVMLCRQDGVCINQSGDLILPENGLPYLNKLELKCTSI